MRSLVLLIPVFGMSIATRAQDSLKKTVPKIYPLVRNLSIQKDYFGDSDYKLYSKDGDVQGEGRFSEQRLRISAALPVYTKNRWSMTASLNYTRENFRYYTKSGEDLYRKSDFNSNNFDALFSVGYRNFLFKKPVVYTATLIAGSRNFFDVKKLSGMVSASLILKATPVTVSTFGLLVNIDQSSLFPFFPVFSYWHKFSGSAWEINTVVPQKVIFRRPEVLHGWLSGGIELGGNSFFTGSTLSGQQGNYQWVANEMYSHVGYEYLFGKSVLLGVKGGFRNTISNRLVKVNERITNYESRTAVSSAFFNLNLGFILPGSKAATRRR
ncbi:hypothetical protein [Pedobacter nutrimenti]|uniref:Uncharacterized protein n=1 Tax=Pedobacter nutrimenti TaxID=1241337 RepID=A0A318UF14_9SPHI|nr:hypothetical protein [Pedobacter nutrimenti]PYF74946.1 hypothetical protein B0O44_103392 [Pedobacter nutrimenti]